MFPSIPIEGNTRFILDADSSDATCWHLSPENSSYSTIWTAIDI